MIQRSSSARIAKHTWAACFSLALCGCTIVDQYGSRAVDYNIEASKSRSSNIVLNILRAAYRQPLQFTDLSTVTGTASASGTISATIPEKIAGPRLTAPSFLNINPSATLSGGPTFSIANQNTQEFYQGIQSPLEPQIFASYLSAGVSLKVLLGLFVSEIELDDEKNNKRIIIKNNANSEGGFKTFNSAIDKLVVNGLDIENFAKNELINEAMTAEAAGSARVVAAQISAGSTPGSTVFPIKASKNGSRKYNLQKSKNDYRFCFRINEKNPVDFGDISVSAINPNGMVKVVPITYADGLPGVKVRVTKEFQCGSQKNTENEALSKSKVGENLKFTYRSLESLLLYLGDIVRTELGLGAQLPSALNDAAGGRLTDFRIGDRTAAPAFLFRLIPNYPGLGISAEYNGIVYTAATDPTGFDASGQVIQIITDLIALKSSAKSLPQPNTVIAVVP